MKSVVRSQMRVLWFLTSERWGGSEQVAISDMAELVREEIPVTFLCKEGSPLHAAAMRYPQINIETFKYVPGRIDFPFISKLRSLVRQKQINIVHINNISLLPNVVPALRGQREVSLVVSKHAPVEASLKNWILSPFFARVDYFTVLSESVRLSLLSHSPIRDRKIKVINLGLDFSRFDPMKVDGRTMRAAWGADKDTVIVGSVGRLDEEVGQATFLKAAAGLMKYSERKMRFVIVGEEPLVASGEYLEELKELVKIFHIEDHVSFSSLGDNLPEVMSAFDIFVMPGREEVPGLGALEALAMERPVVLSKVSGSEDIVGNEEFGLLVIAEDAFDLQQKILHFLEKPSIRLAMGSNGRKYVLRHFDKRIRLNRTLEVYERCMKRRFIGR